MARLRNTMAAPLGLPGGEIPPGESDVSDAALIAARANDTAQRWIDLGMVVVVTDVAVVDSTPAPASEDAPPKKKR